MNIVGNFSNSGTFTANSGTVIFSGANQTITGATTFYNAEFSTTTATADATGGTITHSGGYTIHSFTSNGTFTPSNNLLTDVLVIGGGGGGGQGRGGGGGGGGYQYSNSFSATPQAYSVTVGGGGANNTNGTDSTFSTITGTGGGRGGGEAGFGIALTGAAGGSGGGGAATNNAGGSGSQGFTGGIGGPSCGNCLGGGGGGAGGFGIDGALITTGGNGGPGIPNPITGSSVTYAGGGGGSGNAGTPGAGGSGGGGAGTISSGATGGAGTANTGGGGGGGSGTASRGLGGAGGSGVIIIRYLTPVTYVGTTLSSSITVSNNLTIDSNATLIAGSNSINLAGNWANSGTFTANTGTVTLNGGNQTISGSTTFYNFTKSTSSAPTLTFTSGSTQTIASGGTLTLAGTSGHLLLLRSSATPTRWNLNVNAGATQAISYVDVMDSDGSSGATVHTTSSADSGHNLNWFIDTTPPSITLATFGSYTSNNTPTFSGTSTDASSTVSSVQFQIDGTGGSWSSCTATDSSFNSATEAFNCTSSSLAEGSHTIYVRSTDSNGNTTANVNAATSTFIADTVAPSVNAGTNKTASSTFSQDGTASDSGSGIASYLWSKVSGSGTITFGTGSTEDTTVSANTDDTYVLKLLVTDNAGNSASSTFTLIWDTTAPTTSDDYGARDGVWQTSNQTITLTENDALSGTASTKYCEDSINTCNPSSGFSYSSGVLLSTEGITYFRYASTDNAGNTQTTVSRTIKLDKTAPIVTDDVPSSWQTSNFVVTLTCDDTSGGNSGCTKVYYTTDGTTPTATSSFVNSGTSYQFTDSTEGDFVLKYLGEDTAGNLESTVTASNHLRLDKTMPTVSMTAPTDNSTVSGNSVTVSANANDNISVSGVQFKLDTSTNIDSEDILSPYSINFDSTGVADGPHTIIAVARDPAGNYATSSAINITIDNTAPVRSNDSPSGTLAINTSTTTISLDTNEVATCKYSISSSTSYGSMTAFDNTASTSHSSLITGLSNGGSYVYYVKCRDGEGNTNSSDFTISFNVQADITSPSVTITAPDNNEVVSGSSVALIADATDDVSVSGVQFKLDTSTNIGAEDTIAPYTSTLDTSSLLDGDYTIIAVAHDGTGNYSTSSVVTLTVDNTAPTVDAGTDKTKNSTFTQDATASDANGIASYFWSQVSGPGSVLFGATTSEDTNISADTDGTYVLKLMATDVAGNSASSTFTLIWDQTLPLVDAGTDKIENSTFTQDATASDANGIASYFWSQVSGPGTISFSATTSEDTNISANTDGNYLLKLLVADIANNFASSTFNLIWDTTAPTISNISPASGANISASGQVITYSLNEFGDCRLGTSQKSYDQMSGDTICTTNLGVQISCTAPDLGGSGTKNIYLACEDNLGNKDSSGTATHVTYVVPSTGGGRGTSYGGGGTISTANQYAVSINNGSASTDNRQVSLSFTGSFGSDATAIILANNPDFYGATIIPFQNSYSFNLCDGNASCSDGTYIVYAKFMNPYGVSYPVVSSQIYLNAVPLTTEIASTTTGIINTISSTTKEIIGAILPPPKEETVSYPPIETSVPETPQYVFLGKWQLNISSLLDNFVFASLPNSFKNTIEKFPDITGILAKVGITRLNDIGKLTTTEISLPGLAETVGLTENGLALSTFSKAQINKIPTDIVFVRTASQTGVINGGSISPSEIPQSGGGKIAANINPANTQSQSIDLNVKLSITNDGLALQKVNTIQGKPLSFVVKPNSPAKSVEGYLIFKSNKTAVKNKNSLLTATAYASEVSASNIVDDGPDLVLNKFEYKETQNGVWTADVASPQVLGQYELRTVVNFKNTSKAPEKISMIVVVDPEGYVFEKLSDGKEVRLSNAKVSIYWQNPKTMNYEIWPAKDFRQENPQTTDVTGRYSFLVPTGMYYLTAHLDSYSDYKSEPFQVEESKGVFINIELKGKFALFKIFNLQNILLMGIFALLAYLAVIFTIRRRKNTGLNLTKNSL